MICKVFVMQVNFDVYEEYQCCYNFIWLELEVVLKDYGVYYYVIYFDKECYFLFVMVEIELEVCWEVVVSMEVCQCWWKYMCEVMFSNLDNSLLSVEFKEVFYLV